MDSSFCDTLVVMNEHMNQSNVQTQVMIIGAGPIGVELACALKRAKVDYVHVDAGQLGQTIMWYPRQVKFFSSPERISLAGLPLHTSDQSKATREEYLAYLRGVVEHYDLKIQSYERVTKIEKQSDGSFRVHTKKGVRDFLYQVKQVVLAIGDMHRPRLLHIPGEEMEHVSHYFDEPHRYFQQKLLIVGGRNSAVEAAIRCFRAGAQVTLSYRGSGLDENAIKYWLLPEFNWLVKHGHIRFYPDTVPSQITRTHVTLKQAETAAEMVHVPGPVEADFVLLLTGYEMDTRLISEAGAKLGGVNNAPLLDEATMQTTVPGLFVAGTAAAGTQIKFRLFIENCHAHVEKIAEVITGDPQAGVFKRTGTMREHDVEQMPES